MNTLCQINPHPVLGSPSQCSAVASNKAGSNCRRLHTACERKHALREPLARSSDAIDTVWNTPHYTLNSQPSTLNPQPSNLKPQPSTLNPQPSTLDPQPSLLNPQPSPLTPQPSTIKGAHTWSRGRGLRGACRASQKCAVVTRRARS